MATIKLGSAPATFNKTISFDLVNGEKGEITFEFVYRTRSEYAALVDELSAQGKLENFDASMTEIYKVVDKSAVDFILKAAKGWDLEDKFTPANVAKLVDQFPGAFNALTEAYRSALLDGRTKN
ncbi:phage tail assembly chaperone [Methylobacillus sp.]|uniref:phage tail assembly chaperone n=1 Tax=Methylobacillus sp. TaxID=56818 RepID=UPI002FE360B5